MNLTLGFSPCPNDTFIFDALVNNKIETEGITFNIVLEDVQTLNEWAIAGKLDITKLSYGVLPMILDEYILLNSGSALGNGVGPLLITNKELGTRKVEDFTIAIPGENTTAHLLFSLAFPAAKNKIFLRYSEIEDFILDNAGLGVIIHENRFTYINKGLKKIADLGDYWEKKTGNAIPLGGMAIKRNIDNPTALKIDSLIRQSIKFAFSNYPEINNYVRRYAKEIDEDVIRKHIDLYVNNYSLYLGEKGKSAVQKLFEVYEEVNNVTLNSEWLIKDQDIKGNKSK